MSESYCSFYLDQKLYGIPTKVVEEVLKDQPLTPVPLAARAVQGILHLRGRILTVLNLRERLGLPPRPAQAYAMHILVRPDQETISLMVDRIGDVVSVEDSQFEKRPEAWQGPSRALLLGTYKLKIGLLLAVDAAKAAAVD